MNHPARPQVKATVGGNAPPQLGMDALLDFRMEVTLEGRKPLEGRDQATPGAFRWIGLNPGKWVEVDHERLNRTLEQFEC